MDIDGAIVTLGSTKRDEIRLTQKPSIIKTFPAARILEVLKAGDAVGNGESEIACIWRPDSLTTSITPDTMPRVGVVSVEGHTFPLALTIALKVRRPEDPSRFRRRNRHYANKQRRCAEKEAGEFFHMVLPIVFINCPPTDRRYLPTSPTDT